MPRTPEPDPAPGYEPARPTGCLAALLVATALAGALAFSSAYVIRSLVDRQPLAEANLKAYPR